MGLLDDLYSTELGAIRGVPDTTRANYAKLKGLLGFDSTGNGLLSDLQYGARNALSQAKWNAGNRLDNIQRFVTDPEYRNSPEVGKAMREAFDQYADAMAPGNMGGAVAGMIKASHGSPHAFEKFDFTKIGSGEGNQSYGHGGYFAQGFDSPVAKEYQKQLAEDVFSVGNEVFDPSNPSHMAAAELMNYGGDSAKAISDIQKSIKELGNIKADWREKTIQEKKALIDLINKGNLPELEDISHGHLYNVELKWPDAAREAADPLGEHHLLDYDVALGSQPTHVLKAIKNIPESKLYDLGINPDLSDAYTKEPILGKDFLGYVSNQLGKKQGSNYLNSFGIPGIRYLDQASRNAGYGTHNYVIFDDAIPRIVARNGKSLLED